MEDLLALAEAVLARDNVRAGVEADVRHHAGEEHVLGESEPSRQGHSRAPYNNDVDLELLLGPLPTS
jgi:hypothetical protein